MDKENFKGDIIDDNLYTAVNLKEIQQDKVGGQIEINNTKLKIEGDIFKRRSVGILKECYVKVTDVMKNKYYDANNTNSICVGEEFRDKLKECYVKVTDVIKSKYYGANNICVGEEFRDKLKECYVKVTDVMKSKCYDANNINSIYVGEEFGDRQYISSEQSCVKFKHRERENYSSRLKNAEEFGALKDSNLQNRKINVVKGKISKHNLKQKKVVTINKHIKYKTDVRGNILKGNSSRIHGENFCAAEEKSVSIAVEIKNNKIDERIAENRSLINVKGKKVADELNHDERYECFTCGFLSTVRRNFLHHQSRHVKERATFECYICGLITISKAYLKTHQRVKHSKEEPSFHCSHCSYKTASKYYFSSHQKYRHGKDCKLFTCTRCDFTTKYSLSLKIHMKSIHEKSDADLLFCYSCKYRTLQRRLLVRHIQNMHQKEIKWHACERCSVKTKYKSSLNQHVKMYHDERYEWPKCPHCTFQPRDKHTLTTHMKLKHKSLLLKCKLCNFRACWDTVIDAHVRKVHS